MSDQLQRMASTPEPPYWAVIFTSRRTAVGIGVDDGYDAMSDRMNELGAGQPGFLGIESARGADGLGITVSYWASEADLLAWKRVAEHRAAQETGRAVWYSEYFTRVAKVERAYSFTKE